RRRLPRLSASVCLVISVIAVALALLLGWSFIWFGLNSQCGGGYGSCTSPFHAVSWTWALVSAFGVGCMLLLALGSLLCAVMQAARPHAHNGWIIEAVVGILLLLGGIIVTRIGAPLTARAVYGVVLLLVLAAAGAGRMSGRLPQR